jgi:hypothetical protein
MYRAAITLSSSSKSHFRSMPFERFFVFR